MVFLWSLSDSKSSQVTGTLLRILADLYYAVGLMVPTFPLFSPNLPVPVPNHLGLFWVHELQMVSPSLSCVIVFFQFHEQGLRTYLSFHFLLILLCYVPGRQSQLFGRFFFFRRLSQGLVVWPRLEDLFLCQNRREFYASHSWGQILDCS